MLQMAVKTPRNISSPPDPIAPQMGGIEAESCRWDRSRAGGQVGCAFPSCKGFPEAMPSAPALPSPIPNPFEGVTWGHERSQRGDASVPCDGLRDSRNTEPFTAVQCGGQVFLFILLLAFSWGGKPPQRPQRVAQSSV